MIRRFVFFRFKAEFRGADALDEIYERSCQVLSALPQVCSFEVGLASDPRSQAAWDLSITATFTDLESMEAYIMHPEHRAYVDGFIKSRLEVIKAWNFSSE